MLAHRGPSRRVPAGSLWGLGPLLPIRHVALPANKLNQPTSDSMPGQQGWEMAKCKKMPSEATEEQMPETKGSGKLRQDLRLLYVGMMPPAQVCTLHRVVVGFSTVCRVTW